MEKNVSGAKTGRDHAQERASNNIQNPTPHTTAEGKNKERTSKP